MTPSHKKKMGQWVDSLTLWVGCNDSSSLLVHLNVLLYALCFWIQQPILGYLSTELGANPVMFGSLDTLVSVLSLVGGGWMGSLTDTKGAKFSIMVCQLGSLVMYLIMSCSTSFELLVLSRLPAIVQHTMLCSQAALSKLSDPEKRSIAIGRLSLSYGIGMVVGSPVGGYASQVLGYRGVAGLSALLSFVIVVVDILFLPDFSPTNTAPTTVVGMRERFQTFFKVIKQPKVAAVLLMIFPVTIGVSSFRSMFSLVGKSQFGMESKDMGVYIACAALCGLLANVFVVSIMSKRFGNMASLSSACLLLAICYSALSFVTSYPLLIAWTLPSTIASTLLYTLSSSLMSLAVPEDSVGTAISLSHASRSFAGIVSPLIGGTIYEYFGFLGLGYTVATCSLTSFVAIQLRYKSLEMKTD